VGLLLFLRQRGHIFCPHGGMAVVKKCRALEACEQVWHIWHDFHAGLYIKAAAQRMRQIAQPRLRGSAKHCGRTTLPGQKIHSVAKHTQAAHRDSLHFIKHYHATCKIMHAAGGACACAKQALKKLHHGGEDHGGIPVFRQFFPPAGDFFSVRIFIRHEIGMMLKRYGSRGFALLKNFSDYIGILVNNGRIRNDIDNSVHLVLLRVQQGKTKAGQRLAPASGYSESKHTRRILGTLGAMGRNITPDVVDGVLRGLLGQGCFKTLHQGTPRTPDPAAPNFRPFLIFKICTVSTIRINQAAE